VRVPAARLLPLALLLLVFHASAGAVEAGKVLPQFGKGVTFEDPEGRFSLTLRGRIQLRAEAATSPTTDLPSTEFLVRRLRLVLSGHALSKAVGYYIQLGLSNLDVEPDLRIPLRDAYVTWAGPRDFQLRAGQMKVPYGRQRVVSSSALQFTDRSIVTAELNLDRDVGVVAFSEDLFGLGGLLGYSLGVFGGDGRNRTSPTFGVLSIARLEVNPFGTFDTRAEADVERLPSPRLSIGVGGGFNRNTNRPRSTTGTPYTLGTFDYAHAGADLTFKWAGFSLLGELMARWTPGTSRLESAGRTEFARSSLGWFVQAGQMLDAHWEVAARVGQLSPLAPSDPALVRSREAGAALSHYFEGHALKLQADYFYLFGDDLAAGRHQVRLQGQLYF
jgi:hypothetical protein